MRQSVTDGAMDRQGSVSGNTCVGRERAFFRWRDRDVGNGIAPTA